MKTYKIQDENNYLGKGLSQFSLFQIYSLYDIIRYFDSYEFDLTSRSRESDNPHYALKRGSHPYLYIKKFKQPYKYINMTYKVDSPFKFVRDKGEFKKMPVNVSTTQLRREDSIRTLVYPAHFIYFKVPYEFLLDNLTQIFCPAEMQKVFKAFEGVDASIYKNIVDTFNKYDKIYTEVIVSHQNKKFKWRYDIFPDMLYSMAKYGVGYPLINGTMDQIFFDGTHRLSCAPIAKIDYPVLQYLHPSVDLSKPFYICSTPFFNNGKHVIFDIMPERPYIGGWFVSTSMVKNFATVFPDYRVQIEHPEVFKTFTDKLAASEYDFKFII